MLEKALDIPVLSEHDARLAAYAEWKNREKIQSSPITSLVTLRSIGLGVGAGIVIEGKMVRGQIGTAGEIGHIIYLINPDCIILDEDYPDYPPFLEKVKQTLKEFVHPYILESISVRFSDSKDDTILLGGYYLVLEQRFQENTLIDYIKEAVGGAGTE